jgi:hypothetical protein
LLAALWAACACLRAADPSARSGMDYWIAVPPSSNSMFALPSINLFLTIASVPGATGTVSSSGLGISTPFTVGANSAIQVSLTSTVQLGDAAQDPEVIENKGIEVTASAPVVLYLMSFAQYTADGFAGVPVPAMGTTYELLSYVSEGGSYPGSEFGVVAASNGTILTITPSQAWGTRTAGTAFQVTLNQGQTYYAWSENDLTGTLIVASAPVAVISGNQGCEVPLGTGTMDYLVEDMAPVNAWGTEFLTQPLATRSNGDTFKAVAIQAGTQISQNGTAVSTLASVGSQWQSVLTSASVITSTAPILLGQYANGHGWDNDANADPSETQIFDIQHFAADYLACPDTSDFGPNYLNIVAPAADAGVLTINGFAPTASVYSAIGTSGYVGASLAVACDPCRVTAPQAFGCTIYGWASYNAYAYPAEALAPVETPTPSGTPTVTSTISPTLTFSPTATVTPSPSDSPSASDTPTLTPSPTVTPTFSATPTFSSTPTLTSSPTSTETSTVTATFTRTASPSSTATVTQSFTASPTATATPLALLLTPRWPNPDPAGGDGVWLPYTVSADALVRMEIFDIAGEKVRTFDADPEAVAVGNHERFWDLHNSSGRVVASGVFLVRIEATAGYDAYGPPQTVWEKCSVVR